MIIIYLVKVILILTPHFYSEVYFKSPSLQKPTPIRDVKASSIGNDWIVHLNIASHSSVYFHVIHR